MKTRKYDDWISGFLDYTSYGEAPRHMYFWTAVSTIAGALRRKVWIDQAYFQWYPNFYICLVAPPGIVSKSTTAGLGMKILRQVPGIKFGPDVVTWPALVSAFAGSLETFTHQGLDYPMSPLTLESSEFGNLLDPQDKQMVDLLVALWDGKQGDFKKDTKTSGSDKIENPWINLIACTTPAWISGNFPQYMIGGGFTSRMIFVYADRKEKLVAYPGSSVPPDMAEQEADLLHDLCHISRLSGPYKLTPEAIEWGEAWYERHYTKRPVNLDPERFGGYIARKQTHMHKLALVLAASSTDERIVSKDHLEIAYTMLTDLEPDMNFVFSRIGRSDVSLYVEQLIKFVQGRGTVPYAEAFRHVHTYFPSMREFEDAVAGCMRAGYLKLTTGGSEGPTLSPGIPLPTATNGVRA